jgi:hypothetical protein
MKSYIEQSGLDKTTWEINTNNKEKYESDNYIPD